MKRNILIFLIVFTLNFFLGSKPANAWIPGGATGKVVAELPDGTRIPLPGVKIFRMDWWTWWYCPAGKKCWGTEDGVETTTDENGIYIMDNENNNPGWLCSHGNGAKKCPTGKKGNVRLCKNKLTNSCSDKTDNQICTDPPINSYSLNWCGFNCGSNPHRWEAYFPENYHLPGNLEALGYSHLKGRWEPEFYQENFNNYQTKERKDFVFRIEFHNSSYLS